MDYRLYKPEDYPTIYKWWLDWGWEPFPEIAIPENGIVVYEGDVELAASFIYKTDSCVCWAENFIANKRAPRELRKGAVEFLIESTLDHAKEMGFSIVMSSVNHKGID